MCVEVIVFYIIVFFWDTVYFTFPNFFLFIFLFFFSFLMISRRTIISGSAGLIFAIFSLDLFFRHLKGRCHGNQFCEKMAICPLSSLWHSETKWEDILLSESAVKWWFVVSPLLAYVSALPTETCTPEIGSFQSCCILCRKRLCVGLLYLQHSSTNFDNFFVDNKLILLGTVSKYYFLFSHFCVIPIRKQDQCYQLCVCCVVCRCQDYGQLTQQSAVFATTCRQGLRSSLCWETSLTRRRSILTSAKTH